MFIYLEANVEINGDLGAIFCSDASDGSNLVLVADCEICDLAGECCDRCCPKGVECNKGIHVPDIDPMRQSGYGRGVFNTITEDFFPQELYEEEDQGEP